MGIKDLKKAMRNAGLATTAGAGLASGESAMAGGCDSCDPGCSTCQTCSTGSSNDQSTRTDVDVTVGVGFN